MKSLSLLVLGSLIWTGCAGDDAALEQARYLLGRGGSANATEAKALVEPVLTSGSMAQKFDAYQTYAGAQTVLSGFDAAHTIGVLKFPGANASGATQAVRVVNAVYTSNSSSSSLLSETITKLNTFVESTEYVASTDTRSKAAIKFQRGLVEFLKSLQILIDDSGFATRTSFSESDCVSASSFAAINSNLDASNLDFLAAGLAEGNKLVNLNTDLKAQTGSIPAICAELARQKASQ